MVLDDAVGAELDVTGDDDDAAATIVGGATLLDDSVDAALDDASLTVGAALPLSCASAPGPNIDTAAPMSLATRAMRRFIGP